MNAKMKSCFAPHVMMHSLFGLGLGIILTSIFAAFRMVWLGIVLLVIAVAWDAMRKN